MDNHTEAMQIDFDPNQITFSEIADLFWQSHIPLGSAHSRQYMSALWFHDDSQRAVAEETKKSIEASLGAATKTPILPLRVFYIAEDYHQKYRLQHSPLLRHFDQMYPVFKNFNDSTAAARLNGFVAGNGSRTLYAEERSGYGIPIDDLESVIRIRVPSGGGNFSSGQCSVD